MPSSRYWLSVPHWWLDPAGDNRNKGDDPSRAIRTPGELERRIGSPARITAPQLDIFVQGTYSTSDPFNFHFFPVTNCLVYFHGLETQVYQNIAGGFSNVSALVRGTGVSPEGARPTVTDALASAVWGPNVGNLIKTFEATPRAAWIMADLTGGVARTSRWMQNPTPATTLNPTLVDQAQNETFQVVSLPTISAAHIRMSGAQPNSSQASLIFESLQLGINSSTNSFTVSCDSTNHMKTINCRLGRKRTIGTGNQFRNYGPYIFSSLKCRNPTGTFFYGGGTGVGGSILNESALCEFDGDFFFDGGALTMADYIPSRLYLGAVGIYHAAGDGIVIPEGFSAKMVADLAGVANVYGAATAGGSYGIRLMSGAEFYYPASTKPLVSGSLGDTIIGGTPKQYADIPYTEGLNGAAIVAI